MRVNPIMVKNHYSPSQKVSFGMFKDKKTQDLTFEMMMKEVEWYDEEDKQDPKFGYKKAVDYIKEKLEYFKTSPLFMIKSTKYSDGQDVIYITMNKEEVDKHEHKNLFYETIDRFKTIYDEVRNGDEYWKKKIQQTGMLDEEDFLEELDYYENIDFFYEEMQNNEQGINPEPPEPTSTTPSKTDNKDYDPLADDSSYQAYKLYGV